jgi:phage terminase Nu1 subunit (DNA packaging protein)
MKAIVTIRELAKELNLTPRRIQQLSNNGIIFKVSRGKYDLDKSKKSYIKFINK